MCSRYTSDTRIYIQVKYSDTYNKINLEKQSNTTASANLSLIHFIKNNKSTEISTTKSVLLYLSLLRVNYSSKEFNGWWLRVHLSLPVQLAHWLVVKIKMTPLKMKVPPLLVSFPTARIPVIFFFHREHKSVTTSCLRRSTVSLRINTNSRQTGTVHKPAPPA